MRHAFVSLFLTLVALPAFAPSSWAEDIGSTNYRFK